VARNATGAITSVPYDLADVPIIDPIYLTEDPFIDAANGNFRRNNKAGGGLLLKAAAMDAPALLV